MNTLDGKAAIVTGASRGIGRAIAGELAAAGAHVTLVARNQPALDAVATSIRSHGGRADTCAVDLRLPESAAVVIDAARRFGGRIDVLVNNAGATRRGDFLALTEGDWQDGFSLKFFGAVRLCRLAWPDLVSSRGSVVNIAGVGGRTPGAAFALGGAVNGALLTFTKALAETGLTGGVQVNGVNPGSIRTDRLRARLMTLATERGAELDVAEREFVTGERVTRIGEPEDVAWLVAFLVGPRGRFIHGALIDVDGGATKTL